mgnify:CR=1 FL=1
MESFIIPIVSILAGIYFLVRNVVLLRDREKLEAYIHSPRLRLWIDRFGTEKTRDTTRRYLLPIGIVISLMLLGIGLWGLSVTLG